MYVCLAGLAAVGQEPSHSVTNLIESEPFVIEEDSIRVAFQNDGTSVRDETFRVRIQSDAGVQRYSVLTLGYQGSSETIDVESTRVRKPDGTIVETPAESVQDMPAAITREAPFYSDLHEKHVSVKGLGVGDVLECRTTWKVTKPLIPGQFWMSTRVPIDAVIRSYRLEVSFPRERPVKWHGAGMQPVSTEDGQRRVLTWTASGLSPKRKERHPNLRMKRRAASLRRRLRRSLILPEPRPPTQRPHRYSTFSCHPSRPGRRWAPGMPR